MTGSLLHVGMPKTGSSAIQTWLLRGLRDPRVLYLTLGRQGSGNLIAAAFKADAGAHHRNRKRGLDDAAVEQENAAIRAEVTRQLATAGDRTVLFSAELLSGMEPPDVDRVLAALRPHGPVRACGFVRRPVAFVQSVFQQRLKSGTANLNLQACWPDYRRRFAKFEERLGTAAVDWWLFEPARFPRGCVVRAFCERTGIAPPDADPARMNDSLSLPAIRLLYAYRRYGPGYGRGEEALQQNQRLRNRLLALPGPRLRFHADLLAPLLARGEDDLRWIETRLGERLDEELQTGPGCVRTEADLFAFDPEALDWLAAQLGHRSLTGPATPERVAGWMHELRLAPERREGVLRRWWTALAGRP